MCGDTRDDASACRRFATKSRSLRFSWELSPRLSPVAASQLRQLSVRTAVLASSVQSGQHELARRVSEESRLVRETQNGQY